MHLSVKCSCNWPCNAGLSDARRTVETQNLALYAALQLTHRYEFLQHTINRPAACTLDIHADSLSDNHAIIQANTRPLAPTCWLVGPDHTWWDHVLYVVSRCHGLVTSSFTIQPVVQHYQYHKQLSKTDKRTENLQFKASKYQHLEHTLMQSHE